MSREVCVDVVAFVLSGLLFVGLTVSVLLAADILLYVWRGRRRGK